jgi:hypothetical protein
LVGIARGRRVVGNFGTWKSYSLALSTTTITTATATAMMGVSWLHTLGTTPTSLSYVKATTDSPAVRLSALGIDEALLRFHDSAWLALVVHTQNLTSDLELATFASYRQRFEELYLALSVKDMLSVELGYAFNGRRVTARVEINDFLIRVLERKNDRVSGEGSKRRVKFLLLLLELRCRNPSHIQKPGNLNANSIQRFGLT